MLPEDREAVYPNDAAVASATDEFAVPEDGTDAELDESVPEESDRVTSDTGEWYGKQPAYPRRTPEQLHTPDLTTRLYVGLWLPGSGALLTYAAMRGNYWAAFVGVELLLVGWFTLAKL